MATRSRQYAKKRKNPITDIIGEDWMPAHAVRICPDGRVEVLREKNPRSRNPVGFGFRDSSGTFHPITPSKSYLRSIGKAAPKRKARKKTVKAKAKRSKTRKGKR